MILPGPNDQNFVLAIYYQSFIKTCHLSAFAAPTRDICLKLSDGDGNGLIVRVADADVDLLDADALGFFVGFAVQLQ
jgi:hypothetical protein